jgi:hypothetical protein
MMDLQDYMEWGTDQLHEALSDVIQSLPGSHPVRALWERLDQILIDGGPDCLPAPWE